MKAFTNWSSAPAGTPFQFLQKPAVSGIKPLNKRGKIPMSRTRLTLLTGLLTLSTVFAAQAQGNDNNPLASSDPPPAATEVKKTPVEIYDMRGQRFEDVIYTAKVYSDQQDAIYALIASDDPEFTDLITKVMNGMKSGGMDCLYIMLIDKASPESKNMVTFIANGKDGGGLRAKVDIKDSNDSAEKLRAANHINQVYRDHIEPTITMGRSYE